MNDACSRRPQLLTEPHAWVQLQVCEAIDIAQELTLIDFHIFANIKVLPTRPISLVDSTHEHPSPPNTKPLWAGCKAQPHFPSRARRLSPQPPASTTAAARGAHEPEVGQEEGAGPQCPRHD